jgi:hypothetical protein
MVGIANGITEIFKGDFTPNTTFGIDLSDSQVLAVASTLCDHLIEWRRGNDEDFGIIEYRMGPGYYKCKEATASADVLVGGASDIRI